MLRFQLAQQVLNLIFALYGRESLFELRFTHLSSAEICARFGDKHCLLRPAGGRGLIDAAAHTSHSR